ncbi:helix-turn-helix transcriptional regulator [Dickeya sp. CFBP 2040]|uniref:Helix-turn-helix transcriptional regulator n=1 Tax=Dickeya poaceiphila TaxID=568768 RepID=A0A5B8HT87_9GAMM|nr:MULTISPECIES: AraC family transcriptional regulator [Dickeya]NKI73728.1 helix-turn-helix transcriptional regulator [Dickeya sp. CFBP 2040]QDX31516.1 helix-turn-helix transcriptional regulator [Dickeya poaceiphila]
MLERKLTDVEKEEFTKKIMDDLEERHLKIYGKQAKAEKTHCIMKVIHYIIENISEDILLEDLEEISGKTRFDICRIFNLFYGTTPIKWLWKVRLALAKEFIDLAPHWSLTEISCACGFSSLPHFSRSFSLAYNQTPMNFKKDARTKINSERKRKNKEFDIMFGVNKNVFSKNVLINNLHLI